MVEIGPASIRVGSLEGTMNVHDICQPHNRGENLIQGRRRRRKSDRLIKNSRYSTGSHGRNTCSKVETALDPAPRHQNVSTL